MGQPLQGILYPSISLNLSVTRLPDGLGQALLGEADGLEGVFTGLGHIGVGLGQVPVGFLTRATASGFGPGLIPDRAR